MKRVCLLLTALSFALSGCEKFLDQEPLNEFSAATLYQTESDIRLALNNLYRGGLLGFNSLRSNQNGFAQQPQVGNADTARTEYVYALFTDDGVDRAGARATHDFGVASSSAGAVYPHRYVIIRQINEFLANAPKAESSFSDPGLYDRYIAEARLIRAMHYARLSFLYREVPLITEPTGPDDFPKRAEKMRLFEFVSDEFDAVAEVLPFTYSNPNDAVRLNKAAALTLKARHLLNAIDWHPNPSELYRDARIAVETVYKDSGISLGVNNVQNH